MSLSKFFKGGVVGNQELDPKVDEAKEIEIGGGYFLRDLPESSPCVTRAIKIDKKLPFIAEGFEEEPSFGDLFSSPNSSFGNARNSSDLIFKMDDDGAADSKTKSKDRSR